MTREEIIEKLRTKKGFLKKGAQWLADKWEVDIAVIKDCKKGDPVKTTDINLDSD